jgi:metallo-beta-lactamase class B
VTAFAGVVLGAVLLAAPERPFAADPAKKCDDCAKWNAPREPFRVFGNTYYVGVSELSSILITSDAGHILLDGGLTQSAPLIDANIRKLGFKTEDVKLIVNSHAHFDHAGGIAALQRATGARVAASAAGARALESGMPSLDDPQYALGRAFMSFPRIASVRAVADGETLRVGPLAITAHYTPGHTPGSTTWTWRSCEGDRCLDLVYADSVTAISAPGFRYLDARNGAVPADAFRRSLETIAALPCDILLAPHPGFTGIDEKLEKRKGGAAENAFVDPSACRAYAATGLAGLEKRLAEERAAVAPKR